jgi:hypothetical protein
MKINIFPKYIFWSYKENADLPINIIAKNVILYGDVKDIVSLTNLFGTEEIKRALEKISMTNKFKKRINFIEKVIL